MIVPDKNFLRKDTEASLAFGSMVSNQHYDARYKPIHFNVDDWVSAPASSRCLQRRSPGTRPSETDHMDQATLTHIVKNNGDD